ncbi:hypothetical protein DFH11DRAFT_274475 [Phellopilus nigrolimitatus]|nr:hypothetical protein DFH11DRAFT_274475 [Phellopilus nigrolimitatus]
MLGKFALFMSVIAQTTAPEWGQCGVTGWTGATTCPSGCVCTYSSEYYSQCLQGTASSSSATAPAASFWRRWYLFHPLRNCDGRAGRRDSPYGKFLWVRADEEPDFHTYLQSAVSDTAGLVVFGSYSIAASFSSTMGRWSSGCRKCSLSRCLYREGRICARMLTLVRWLCCARLSVPSVPPFPELSWWASN